MNISVVIPNYNGIHLFPETMPALMCALENSGKEFEIIIVDDCSTDGSLEYLRKTYPDVTLLQTPTNSGFSVTVNKGIRTASHDLVLLLNSDVRLEHDYFNAQLSYFDNPDTFGVMGKIIGWYDENVQDGAKYPRFSGYKLKTSGNYLPNSKYPTKPLLTMYLSGANALIRRKMLLQLNGFDEIYSPFYMEDVDLSIRAWRMGWKCYFEPNVFCRHRTSESIRTKEKKRYIRTIYNRNKLFFHAIHLSGYWLIGWKIQVFFELLFRIITFRFDYLLSVKQLLLNHRKVRKSRMNLQTVLQHSQTKMSIHEVVKKVRFSVAERDVTYFKS